MPRKIFYIINVDWFFLSHRLPIALEAMKQGYEVHIACGITNRLAELQSYGFQVHPLAIARGRSNLWKELSSFIQITRLLATHKPDLAHLVTIKPVLFGGIATRIVGSNAVVAAISGLGFMYVARGWKASLKRFVIGCLYKLALSKENLRVIFQNPNDREILIRIANLPAEKTTMLDGSGVDLTIYTPQPLPSGTPKVVMACRLIADKGVWEFIEAARILYRKGISVQMCLAGSIDLDNPMSLSEEDLIKIRAEGIVELLGNRSDMAQVFANAHIAALPSYYGEGLPKVLIEAAACGRAVITTNMPGCREAIEPGITGLLIPPRDEKALADAIEHLIQKPNLCAAYGSAGRTLAIRKFDIHQVVAAHLGIYKSLLE